MIFVTLGNQNFKFTRLLKAIENLIVKGSINESIVVQNGYTPYETDKMILKNFLGKEEFLEYIAKSRFVISHAGTGSIISCLQQGKKVIVAPRIKTFGEHIDDHQLEILKAFEKKNYIIGLNKDFSDLEVKIASINSIKLNQFISNNESFNDGLIKIIDNF